MYISKEVGGDSGAFVDASGNASKPMLPTLHLKRDNEQSMSL
ncbi:MAG TPA: hypothetical protein VFD00_04075 [Thermoclostridium sp.]|nr:hypothetical protein [Thermoclostridium sp.]